MYDDVVDSEDINVNSNYYEDDDDDGYYNYDY